MSKVRSTRQKAGVGAVLATFVVVLCSLTRVLRAVDHHAGTHLALPTGKPTLLLSLAVMFWGVLFRLAYDETGGFRRGDGATAALGWWHCSG